MTPRVNPNVSRRLWVIMMCQCRFISGNKYATLVGHGDAWGGGTCVGGRGYTGTQYFLLSFAVNLKLL